MDILLLIFIAFLSFIFIVYIPTILFYNGSKIKGRADSIILFLGASLLFLLFDYMCTLFYDLKAVQKLVECSSVVFNFSCFYGKYLTRIIYPGVPILFIFFIQILAAILYAYTSIVYIFKAKKDSKVVTYMVLFYVVSILCTLIHYFLLNDVLFDSYLGVISLIGSNFYVMLPFIYLIVIIVMNRDQLRLKHSKNKNK